MRATVWRWISATLRPAVRARIASLLATRSVAIRPGATPLRRTGAISPMSDLMSPTSPGRSTLEVTSPGIGSRTLLERMTQMAGPRPVCKCGRAALSCQDRGDCSPEPAAGASDERPRSGKSEIHHCLLSRSQGRLKRGDVRHNPEPVSYTHLTLPTIY